MGSAERRLIPVSEQFSPPSVPLWDSISNVERQVHCEMDGLEVAKLLVDKTAMAAAYYLRPMDIGWAVDILRRAAVACVRREIRIAKVYEALDFLEKALDEKSAWLVRRYRRELRWDRRNNREGAFTFLGRKIHYLTD